MMLTRLVILQHISLDVIINAHAPSSYSGIENEDGLLYCLMGDNGLELIKSDKNLYQTHIYNLTIQEQ